jgi:hypothetical protein
MEVAMEQEIVRRHFESIGARVRFRDRSRRPPFGPGFRSFRIDIVPDKRDSVFEIVVGIEAPELLVLQTVPKDRHLLLYSRDGQRFLCGHDERDWFVAAVPKRVSTVRDAKLALMPAPVRRGLQGLPRAAARKRKNAAFVRQGEWFFVPVDAEFSEELILKNEPLQRTAQSKPHICEELYRDAGESVYVVEGQIYTKAEYRAKKAADERFGRKGVTQRGWNRVTYARGAVRHQDHATIHLDGWHRVYLNAEQRQSSSVGFLD